MQITIEKINASISSKCMLLWNPSWFSSNMCPEVKNAIEGAIFIANHLKEEDEFNRVSIDTEDEYNHD